MAKPKYKHYTEKRDPNILVMKLPRYLRAHYYIAEKVLVLKKKNDYIEIPLHEAFSSVEISKVVWKWKDEAGEMTVIELYKNKEIEEKIIQKEYKKIEYIKDTLQRHYKEKIKIIGNNIKIEIENKNIIITSEKTEPIIIPIITDMIYVRKRSENVFELCSDYLVELRNLVQKILKIVPRNKYTGKGLDYLDKEDRKILFKFKEIKKK